MAQAVKQEHPKVTEKHIPRNWVMCVYGVPSSANDLRGRLRKVLKANGLWSIDLGGSVYLGVRTTNLDDQVARQVEALKKRVKPEEMAKYRQDGMQELVNYIVGDYDETTAAFFRDKLTENVMADLSQAEQTIGELEEALAGNYEIVNPKTKKPRDLLSTGAGRITSAYVLLDGVQNALVRFQGGGLQKEADRIALKVRQLQAYTKTVEGAYGKWATLERARRKKAEETKAAPKTKPGSKSAEKK